MNKLIQSVLVFALTFIFIGLGAEVYYRFLNPVLMGNESSLSYQRWAKQNIQMNSWGFRDPERRLQKDSPDSKRFVMYGPSNVFGHGLKIGERITEILENDLSTKYPDQPFEVINAGTMTLNILGDAFRLTSQFKKAKLDTDYIVLYYPWNAIKSIPPVLKRYVDQKKANYQAPKKELGLITWLKANSYAYNWFSIVTADKSFKLEGNKVYDEWHLDFYLQPNYFKAHMHHLGELKALTESMGAKLVLLIQPLSAAEQFRKARVQRHV